MGRLCCWATSGALVWAKTCYYRRMISYLRSTQYRPTIKVRTDLQPGSWVRCERPSEAELEQLIALGIDADVLHDTLDPHRPWCGTLSSSGHIPFALSFIVAVGFTLASRDLHRPNTYGPVQEGITA